MNRLLAWVVTSVLPLVVISAADAQSPSVSNPFIGPGTTVAHPYGFYSNGYYGLNRFANVSTPFGTPVYPRGVNPLNPAYRGEITAPRIYNNVYSNTGYSYYGYAPFLGYSSYARGLRPTLEYRGVMTRRMIFW
ncbi:MAG: hypothetical protein JO116_05325 [Planctomycetaceae bacterium]|nr:hypothetical protein [Planctomycetaceae bacterium]